MGFAVQGNAQSYSSMDVAMSDKYGPEKHGIGPAWIVLVPGQPAVQHWCDGVKFSPIVTPGALSLVSGVPLDGTQSHSLEIIPGVTLSTHSVMQSIYHVSGKAGLVHDAAGGALTNVRASPATVIDYLGNVIELPNNSIRYSNARYVNHGDGQTYNTGDSTGWEAFDTLPDGVTLLSPAPTILHEGAGTNYALNSDTPATQSITLAAGDYVVWLDDSDNLGLITLSGGATGTVNSTDVNGLRFTSTGAAITFTHSGSNNIRWQVEDGLYRTSYIPSTGVAGVRVADNLSSPLAAGTNFQHDRGVALVRFTVGWDNSETDETDNRGLLAIRDNANSLLMQRDNGTLIGKIIQTSDGTNFPNRNGDWAVGDEIIGAAIWNATDATMHVNVSVDGGLTWDVWNDKAFVGTFNVNASINLFLNNIYKNELHSARIYYCDATETAAKLKSWVETQARTETLL